VTMVRRKMILKHLVPSGLIMAVCMSCSPTSPSPSQPQESAQTATPVIEVSEAVWGDDMNRGSLFDEEADTKQAMAVVNATLSSRQRAHARYSIGNLAFVEVITSPDPELIDVDATNLHVAVVLGDKPRLVSLPDKALFAHFARNIRPNPDKLEFKHRIRTALLLATNSDWIADESEPTWIDENGILVIHYHRYVDSDSGTLSMRQPPPILQECTLTVDANQDFTLECIDRGYM